MTPRATMRFAPFIQSTVDRLLDEACQDGQMDLVSALAEPLPAHVICEMMGVPASDTARFKRWSDAIAAFLDNLTADESTDRVAISAVFEACLYFLSHAQRLEKESHPETLMSLLVEADDNGDKLSADEVFCNAIFLLAAGLETTTHLIGSGVLSLLRNRDQWERLRADPSLIGPAVEELARFESPFQYMIRTAVADVAVGDQVIHKGDALMLLIGSANRDPDAFPDPDVLDVGRVDNRHLAFGRGIHFCIGAAVARMEVQMALTSIVERLPNLRLTQNDVPWLQKFEFRGPAALPVTW